MSEGYRILSLAEIEPVPYHAREGQKLIGVERLLGLRAAGVNGWTGDAGERLVPEHVEDDEEELYVVVRGRATFTVDGTQVDAPEGTLLHVLHDERRAAVAEEPGTIVLAIGGTPGHPHRVSGWTDFVVADALRRQGRLVEGRKTIERLVESAPGAWFAPYNAACFEALAGESDRAFAHLARAVELEPGQAREHARGDADLDALRDDPRWREVVG